MAFELFLSVLKEVSFMIDFMMDDAYFDPDNIINWIGGVGL